MAAADQIAPPASRGGSLPPPFSRPGELDLFALVLLVRSHLLRTILIALLCLIGTVVYTYRVTPMFASTATIIIPSRAPTSAVSALQAFGGLNILGGGYNVYLDILHSRKVADELIQRYNLMQHYHVDKLWAAEKALDGSSTMVITGEGLLVVTVVDPDRKLAAELANAYAGELERLNGRLAITAAGQQRVYYEQQMIQEKNALADAEIQLATVQQKTSLISPDVQANQDLGALAGAQSNRRQLKVQLQSLQQGETDQNPEIIRLKSQIASVSAQITQMQAGVGAGSGGSLSGLPRQTLQVTRASREVKFHEGLYDAVSHALQAAREQEGREVSVLEVLDPAIPGEIKVWPPRVQYWTWSIILGLVLGVAYTLAEAFIRAILRNETNRARLRAFVLAPRG